MSLLAVPFYSVQIVVKIALGWAVRGKICIDQ